MSTTVPTGLTLAQINVPPTADEWNTAELNVANVYGLPTTSWQAGATERTIFAVVANMQAQADVGSSIAIQGGYLDFAASGTVTFTNPDGTTTTLYVTPDPSIPAQNPTGQLGWLDVLADSVYDVQRILVTASGGPLALLNTSVTTYGPFAPGSYHVAQPGLASKPTYSNAASLTVAPSVVVGTVSGTASSGGLVELTVTAHAQVTGAIVYVANVGGTIEANGAWAIVVVDADHFTLTGSVWTNAWTSGGTVYTPTLATFAADVGGTASNANANAVTQAVTSLIGIAVRNPSQWLGTDTQGNLALAAACRLKLQSISTGGPSGAYVYFALYAQKYAPLLNPPLTGRPATAVTRAISYVDKLTGTVTTVLAKSSGGLTGLDFPQPGTPPPDDGSDVYAVGMVGMAYAQGITTTAFWVGAGNIAVTVAITAYVPIANTAAAQAIIPIAVTTYIQALPIGGVSDPSGPQNVFPLQGLLDAVAFALLVNGIRVQDMTGTLNGVAANLLLAPSEVATFANSGTFVPTVVPV